LLLGKGRTDPWSGATITEIPLASADDLDEAFTAAADAQRDWATRPPADRAAVMRAAAAVLESRKEEITGWLVREGGGTQAKAALEADLVHSVLLEAASIPHHSGGAVTPSDIAGKENRVYRQPAGVVAVISPWNFPLQLSARSVAPALAAGNGVVLKPASDTPVTGGLLLARVLEEAGLPPGLLSVIVGSGSDIGDAIVSHPVPSVVSFAGSTAVGEQIARTAGINRLALELGGNGARRRARRAEHLLLPRVRVSGHGQRPLVITGK
jgi:aldehyde dehydrogenase (NAD+)